MRRPAMAAVAVLAASICGSAEAGVVIPVPPVPGSTSTDIRAINNKNVVAGSYYDASGREFGFVGTLDGNYTTFDALTGQVEVGGLNDDGYVTGFSSTLTAECPYLGCPFLRNPDGTIVKIKRNGTRLDGTAEQVNNHRMYIGKYTNADNGDVRFLAFFGKHGRYIRDFTLAVTDSPTIRGLAPDGTVTGWLYDVTNGDIGLGFVATSEVPFAIEYPDDSAYDTRFERINNKGIVAGGWNDFDVSFSRAFLFDSRNVRFRPIDIPGSTYAYATSVNNAGVATLNVDGAPYIYCTHTKTCPITAGAIEVADRWIAGHAVPIGRPCARHCGDQTRRLPAFTPWQRTQLGMAEARERRLPFRP